MTTIYFIRHSVRFDPNLITKYNTTQSELLKNEKIILSVEGEERARLLSEAEEIQNLDVIYVSNLVRTLATAKYTMAKQKLNCIIDERLDERRVGIPNASKHPDWFVRQYLEPDFKTEGGESQNEVLKRFNEAIKEILETKKGKRIAVFSHGYAILFYLLQFSELKYIDETKFLHITYKDKDILNGLINAPEVFKVEYEDNQVVDIERIIIPSLN
jgi:broad specificity phosphatase PhoE